MLKLSKRMKAVAAMVSTGNILADVGTDHAYIPIALAQRKRIPKAIVMDINQGPLKRAQENINRYRMDSYIQTRLSDGTKELMKGEADTILISGMGGELMIRILEEGAGVCRNADELILQPQSDIREVRAFLRENAYKIMDEDMVCEDGKYYPMMRVIPVETDDFWEGQKELTRTACDIYGPLLLKNGNPALRSFLVRQHRQLTGLIQNLQKQEMTTSIETRILELQKELLYNESAYTILEAIKNAGV